MCGGDFLCLRAKNLIKRPKSGKYESKKTRAERNGLNRRGVTTLIILISGVTHEVILQIAQYHPPGGEAVWHRFSSLCAAVATYLPLPYR